MSSYVMPVSPASRVVSCHVISDVRRRRDVEAVQPLQASDCRRREYGPARDAGLCRQGQVGRLERE